LIIITGIFMTVLSYSQQSGTDSLIARIAGLPQEELAPVFLEISRQLQDEYVDSALYYANRAELILLKDDPETLLPELYRTKGKIYENKLVYDRSLFYFRKAYDAFIKLEELQEVAESALSIGNIHYNLGDFSDAYYYYLQSLQAYERDGDRTGIAMMENNLGIVAHEMGKLEEAAVHYQNAYEIYHAAGKFIDECRALNNIGLIHYDRQQYDSARIYFEQVMDKMEPDSLSGDDERYILSGVYNNLALVYTDLDEYETALPFLRRGLSLARQIDDQYNIGSVYTNLGSLFGKMKQQDSALYYLHRALQMSRKLRFKHLELETYRELAVLHAGAGNYMSAYNWHLRYDTVYKAIFNENQANKIARLRGMYEQELKDRQIEQLHSEAQVQRMLNKVFLVFIVVIVALVIIIAVNLRSKKLANQMLGERNQQISFAMQKLAESEKELQKLNVSKDRIFSVVAHDLRNPVAAVAGFSELLYDNFDQFPVETQKEYLLQITQATQRIQNLLENLLIWARSQMKAVKYDPETFRVRTVIEDCVKELKANLDHKKIECTVKLDRKCMVHADRAMIHTVFRNLIMNAIKFSFPGGKVRISSEMNGNSCRIMVADEGIGIQPEIQKKLFNSSEVQSTPGTTGESGSGLGLAICNEFVKRNGGEITLESEPGNGSTFSVILPVAHS